MIATPPTSERYSAQPELLVRALAGHPLAIDSLLGQLSSANAWLRDMMLETIQVSADSTLWQCLLGCLALHRWNEYVDCHRRLDHDAAERLDQALTRLFVEDADETSVSTKMAVLRLGLRDPQCRLRSAAAALLGLRGDTEGIPVLMETIQSGDLECKLRAVQALGKLKDERGGEALVGALASDDEALHGEASHALAELGTAAVPALLAAMQLPKPHVRWHAVQTLGGINDARTPAALAEALADSDYSVRWAASDALANVGAPAVPSILERLSRFAPVDDTYPAAYHALHRIGPGEIQARLQPVLQALRGPAASVEAPRAAFQLLQNWGGGAEPTALPDV